MNLEVLIYVAVGILWLVLQALGRKKKAQQTAPNRPERPPVTLKDVLNEIEWVPTSQPQVPAPAPREIQPHDILPTPQPVAPAPVPVKPRANTQDNVPSAEHSAIIDQLRDPQSAQSAVIVAEVLGKPRAFRRPRLIRL